MPPLAFPGTSPADLPQREYAWWKELVAATFAGIHVGDFERFFGALFDYFAQVDAWEVFPDTPPALAALKEHGARLGVVSNFDARLHTICAGLGIAGDLDAIIPSSRAGYAKPDARIFALALARLDIPAAQALHVGDSPREDIEGAQAAGMRALLIDRSGPAHDPQRVSDLRELVDRL
jgi:putative hydrolase of the HAD superfamily